MLKLIDMAYNGYDSYHVEKYGIVLLLTRTQCLIDFSAWEPFIVIICATVKQTQVRGPEA